MVWRVLPVTNFHDPLPVAHTVQRYDWGSVEAIPQLLGVDPDGEPQAELWLGAHDSAPSIATVGGERIALDRLITHAPGQMLGRRVVEQFGPRLPYLLKVLAAGRALSLQVHPSLEQAREGYALENAAGVELTDPARSFKDDQHKPEMMVALTQFEGLAGFRSARAILDLLDGLKGELVSGVRESLSRDRGSSGMHDAFHHLLSARSDENCGDDIRATVESIEARLEAGSPFPRADRTVVDLARQHTGDPGAIASLMLNRVSLEPGEALFVTAGVVHAYLSGLGIEIMANSDNVLRAGLTTKRVDEENLVRCTSFAPRSPAVPEMTRQGGRGQVHTYRVPVSEFALTMADVDPAEEVVLPHSGPRIVLCLAGEAALACADGTTTAIRRGESVFVPHAAGALTASGTAHLTCAWVP